MIHDVGMSCATVKKDLFGFRDILRQSTIIVLAPVAALTCVRITGFWMALQEVLVAQAQSLRTAGESDGDR